MTTNIRSFRAGQQIISRASRERNVYLIVSGSVRISMYSASGKEVSFRNLLSGSTFGEISAIDGLPRSANVEALEDCQIAVLTFEAFMTQMRTQPEFLARVLNQMAATIRSLSERLFELSTLGIQSRVRAELLRLAKDAGVHHNRAVIDPAPKHIDIASRVSVNREQVTKELSAMVRQGLLAREKQTLVVADVARLERVVRDNGG